MKIPIRFSVVIVADFVVFRIPTSTVGATTRKISYEESSNFSRQITRCSFEFDDLTNFLLFLGYPPASSVGSTTRKRSYEESSNSGAAGNYPPAKRYGSVP
jgi:hypothetical protein